MSVFGSCCEEQEAQIAERRKAVRSATEEQESRLMHRGIERDAILRSVHTGETICGPCDEDGDGDEDDFGGYDDDIEAVRAQRLDAMRATANKEAELRAQGYSTYCVLASDPSFRQLRGCHVSVVHIVQSGDPVSDGTDGYLTRVAGEFKRFKFYRTEDADALLEYAGRDGPAPLVVAFRGGKLIAVLELVSDERDDVTEALASFLSRLREGNDRAADSDDEEAVASFCGKKGCGRTFPHEHVEWSGKKAAETGSSSGLSDSEND
jgi:hypothetical protein